MYVLKFVYSPPEGQHACFQVLKITRSPQRGAFFPSPSPSLPTTTPHRPEPPSQNCPLSRTHCRRLLNPQSRQAFQKTEPGRRLSLAQLGVGDPHSTAPAGSTASLEGRGQFQTRKGPQREGLPHTFQGQLVSRQKAATPFPGSSGGHYLQ